MVGHDGGEASQVAVTMRVLPVHSAKHAVQVHQGGRSLLIGPRESSPIEVYLLKREVIDEAEESSHHAAIQVAVILASIA